MRVMCIATSYKKVKLSYSRLFDICLNIASYILVMLTLPLIVLHFQPSFMSNAFFYVLLENLCCKAGLSISKLYLSHHSEE